MPITAVNAAEQASAAWQQAVEAQRAATPEHGDLYRLAGEMAATLRALSLLTEVITPQIARYGEGRTLRDDAGMHPGDRLFLAEDNLVRLQTDLAYAMDQANRFWSQIGHVGVEP